MNKLKLIVASLLLFSLVGCDVKIETEVKLSELEKSKTKEVSGDLYAYVDDEPIVTGKISIPAGKSINVRLSDVSVSQALETMSAPVILR